MPSYRYFITNKVCVNDDYFENLLYFQIAELSHSVSSPMSFRVEYKRTTAGPAMFQRQVRFQVDISTITKQTGDNCKDPLYAITFTLLSGNFCGLLCIF